MSVRLLGRAFYAPLPAHLKLTLLALADEANDHGQGIFIGQKRLAQKVGSVDRTVRRNLGELRALGYIVREDSRHPRFGTDQYEIVVDKLPQDRADDVSAAGPPDDMSAPDTDDRTERTPTSAMSGHPRPVTRELPVRKSTREIETAAFVAFWDVYPRRAAKRDARKAFAAALKRAPFVEIIEGAERYRDDPNRDPAYTAHPKTWLGRDGWEDDPLPAPSSGKPDKAAQLMALADRAREVERGGIRGDQPALPAAGGLSGA